MVLIRGEESGLKFEVCWYDPPFPYTLPEFRVVGEGIDVRVYGDMENGPWGRLRGKGAAKHRNEILRAIDEYRKEKGLV